MKYKNYKCIKLIFDDDDDDFFSIDTKDISCLILSNITKELNQTYTGSLIENMFVNDLLTHIKPEANQFYTPNAEDATPRKKFDKIIEDRNIVAIILRMEDDTEENYWIYWPVDDKSYDSNPCCKAKTLFNGELCISIKP